MLAQKLGKLDPESGVPLYLQLQRRIRRAIESGELASDETLPPERDLATDFAVSRVTVRKALDGLVSAHLLSRRQGAGTFVATRVEKNSAALTSFTEDMISRGRRPHSRWLTKSEGTVSPEEALALGLGPGTAVYRLSRVRMADDQSMALEHSTVPADALRSTEDIKDSLYDALGEHRPVRVLQRLRAVLFNAEQAELLGIEAGDPGLEIERRGFDATGRTVEFTRSFYRGDAYDFVSELSVVPR
jgi:GntR family transcriptional regulator